MKKLLRRWLISFGILAGLIALGLGYLGFLPGISALFGSNRPVDLGAAPTESDRVSANQKFDQEFTEPESASAFDLLRSARPVSVDTSLTEREIAAHIMETHPISELQIKFDRNGTFEAAGKIDKSRIASMIESLGFSQADQLAILNSIDRYIPGQPTFYLAGRGAVSNDQATLTLSAAKIGRLPMATGPMADGLVAYAEAVMKQVPGFDVASLTIENGQAVYRGTAPAVVPVY